MSPRLACPNCGESLELSVRATRARPDVDRDQELHALVLETVTRHAPIAANDLQRKVRRRRADVRAALRALEDHGRLRRDDAGAWGPVPVPSGGDTPEREPHESNGHDDLLDRAERLIHDNADMA